MKVWITKYALTTGIYAVEVNLPSGDSPDMVVERGRPYPRCYHKGDWYVSYSEAVAIAEDMRVRKLKSLKKSIAKFEKMKF